MVDPSGLGKDSVMAGLVAQRPGLCAVRRVITQAATLGGENFEAVTEAEFVARVVVGAFVLHWQAHGLRYGITVAVRDDLDQGHDVLANLSRGVLALAQTRLERVVVLNLTARPDILVTRLGLRGREVGADLAERLARPAPVLPAGLRMISLANDGPLADTVTAALSALYPGNS